MEVMVMDKVVAEIHVEQQPSNTRAPVAYCGCLLQYSGLAPQQQVAEHAKSKSFEEEGKSCDNLAISSS